MTKVNIREALNQMDKDTNCKYDLVTLYEGYNFNDEEKKEIAKMISDDKSPEEIYDKLVDKFSDSVTTTDDDDISDIKESFGDDLIDSQYLDDTSDGHWSWDYDDDELANIYGGDTKYDYHPDGIDIDEYDLDESMKGFVRSYCDDCGKMNRVKVEFKDFNKPFEDTIYTCSHCGAKNLLTDPHEYNDDGTIKESLSSRYIDKDGYVSISNIANYIVDTFDGDLDDRYDCINSLIHSFKDEGKVSTEVIDQFAGGHNLVDKKIDESTTELVEDSEETDDLISAEQEFDSAATSINSSKLPAVYNMVKFNPGDVVVDFGGGKFDNAVNYLKDQDVTLLVYDPYNRSAEHNKDVLRVIKEHGGADAAVNSNVLNVIKESEARKAVLQNIKKITKKGAPIYITVYEGTGKGNEGPTKSGYQLNRKTSDYMDEISQVFSNVKRKGKLITAINESLNEDTQLKLFDDDMINDIEILHQWRPEEVEKILVKHGASPNNDTWITGLDLPAAYSEIMSTFRDKYSDYDEIDYSAAKVLGLLDESLKEESSNKGWVKRWNFLDNYYKGDLVISKISSPVDAWHVEKVAPNGHTIKHLGNYKSLEVAMDAAEKHLIKNESKSIKESNKIAYGNEKYKGYMIRQDRKYGGYNVYDKEDEMEDSGFTTIDKAKEFIDSLEESKSIKESSSGPKYVTRDIINKTNSQKLKDAYDEGELEVLINGDIWYTERCPKSLGKELKAEMKRLYPNIRHLYGESVESELEIRKQNYLKAKKDFETLGEKDNNDVLSREEKMLVAKAEYEKVLGHPIDESKSLKEDYSDKVFTLSRYLDVEVPDICREVLDLIEHLPSYKISYATKICRDFYANMENIINNYIMTGDNLKESSYGGAFDIPDDAYFTKEDGMIAANEVAYQLEKEFPEAKLEVMDMQLDNHSFYVVLTDKDGNEFTEEITLDMRKIRHPLDLIKKYAPALTERFIKQIKDYYSEM